MIARPVLRLLERIDEFRRGAEERRLLAGGIVEQDGWRRMGGGSVEEHQRRAACKCRHEPVPHHPAKRGEVEYAVARADGRMELMLLEVLEKRAACRMHDALRHTGSA